MHRFYFIIIILLLLAIKSKLNDAAKAIKKITIPVLFFFFFCSKIMNLTNKLISYLSLMGNNSLHIPHFNYFETMLIEAAVRLLPESS